MLEKLQKDVDEANKHEVERGKIEGELNTLKTEHQTLKEKIDDIKLINNTNRGLESENEDILKNLEYSEEEKEYLDKKLETLNKQVKKLTTQIEKLDSEKRFASIALTTIKEEMELENKNSNLKEMGELEEYLINKEKELNSFTAPTKTELKVAEQLDNKIKNTSAQLDAIGLTITTNSLGNISGSVLLDNSGEEFELNNGEEKNWKAHQSVKIVIKDLIDFEIKSGSHDVEELRSSLDEMKLKYGSLLNSYKCNNLDCLRDALIKNNNLNEDIKRTKNVLNKKYKDGKETLLKEIGELEGKVQNNWNIIPEDSPYRLCKELEKNYSTDKLSNKINKLENEIKNLKNQNIESR